MGRPPPLPPSDAPAAGPDAVEPCGTTLAAHRGGFADAIRAEIDAEVSADASGTDG